MVKQSIYDQENKLFDEWINSYPQSEQEQFCKDGLCSEEEMWLKSQRRIVFLMKETNDNPGEDYQDWDWSIVGGHTFTTNYRWLQGLSITTKDFCPLTTHQGDYFNTPDEVQTTTTLNII